MPKAAKEHTPVPKDTPKSIIATINLNKRTHRITFKRKATRAVREIKKFAAKLMSTTDVRIDADLNKFVWSQGVRNIPDRVRVRVSRRRNEDEEAADKMFTVVEHVPVDPRGYKTLTTEKEDN